MEVLITLIIICAVSSVLIWLIQQITFGPPILKSLLILLVILIALIKIFPLL